MYEGFDPPTPPSPDLGFASLAYCWRIWRWLKSCGSAVLLPRAHTSPQHPVHQGCTPVLSQTPWVPATDLHPGAPKACPCKPGWGHLLLDAFMGYADRSLGCGSGRLPAPLGKRMVIVRHCSQLSFSICFLSLMSALMFPDTFTFLFLVRTQGKVSLTHIPISP